MRSLFATAAVAVLFYGAGASAQIAGVITSQTVDLFQAQLGQPSNVYSTSPTITGGGGAAQYYTDQQGSALYNNYQVATVIQPGYIEFANNATSSGFYNSITATTSIAVTYTNPTNHTVTPTLNSTILPGGFGFYMGDLSAGYNGGIADINKVPESTTTTFFDTNGYSGSTPTDTEQVGLVSFEFDILSGGNNVASYRSSLALTLRDCCANAGPGLYTPYTSVTGDLTQNASAMTLNNFTLIAADDPNKAIGWSWDATDIAVPLDALGAGESSTLSYVTIVHTETYSPGQPYHGQNLIAYSGLAIRSGRLEAAAASAIRTSRC